MEFKIEADPECASAILKSMEFEIKKDELYSKNEKFLLFDRDVLFYVWEGLSKVIGKPTYTLMYRMGYDYGSNVSRHIDLGTEETKAIKKVLDISLASGIGRLELEKDEKEIKITCAGGFSIGRVYKETEKRINITADIYWVGFYNAILEKIYGEKMKGDETKCIAKGDEICEFTYKWG